MFQTPFGGVSLIFSLTLVLLGRGFFIVRDMGRMISGKQLGEIPMRASSAEIRSYRTLRPSRLHRTFSYMIPFLFIALIGGNTAVLVTKLFHDEKRYTLFTPLELAMVKANSSPDILLDTDDPDERPRLIGPSTRYLRATAYSPTPINMDVAW